MCYKSIFLFSSPILRTGGKTGLGMKQFICLISLSLLFSCVPNSAGRAMPPVTEKQKEIKSEAGKSVLLINSDDAVEKYRSARIEFRENISHKISVTEIDMADKKTADAEIENLISDNAFDLIYCIGTKAYSAARYAGDKPVVFSSVINWMRLPDVSKAYGVSNELHSGMQLMLFHYIFPGIRKIGILYSRQYADAWLEKVRSDAEDMELEIVAKEISDKAQTLSALDQLLKGPEAKIDAFWLISDPMIMSDKSDMLKILKKCDAEKKPVFSYHETFAEFGTVLTISADNSTIGRQAAAIASELLDNNKPQEKVQFPAGTYIILNLKKAKALGLQYNEDALDSVNQIIQ